VCLRWVAKGHVTEWLGKLEACKPRSEQKPDIGTEPNSSSPLEPLTVLPVELAPGILPIIELKLNPRSSSFIPVTTPHRTLISLPPPSTSAPMVKHGSSCNPTSSPATVALNAMLVSVPLQRLAYRYLSPSQLEMKYSTRQPNTTNFLSVCFCS